MGLTTWLMGLAASRPRPLVVPVPYGTRTRLAVEAEITRRRWAPAATPAEANIVTVCGTPADELAEAVDRVWATVPLPRALVRLASDASPAKITEALDEALARLADRESQRGGPAEPDAPALEPETPQSSGSHESGSDHMGHAGGHAHPTAHDDASKSDAASGHTGHDGAPGHTGHGDAPEQMAHGGVNPDDTGHGGGHAEHGGGHAEHMGHGGGHGHHMGEPGGLKMAERGADRDGLTLDRLHVPLGPILADWPTGLIVETVLQGDVIQEATVRVAAGIGGESFWAEPWLAARRGRAVTRGEAERRRFAAHLDGLGRLLAVAGWADAAGQARRLRDRALAGEPGSGLAPDFRGFGLRVGRSQVLRWMLRDVGRVPRGQGQRDAEDVLVRVERWLVRAQAALEAFEDESPLDDLDPPAEAPVLEALPGLLAGTDLAAARLIVAALNPDVERLTAAHDV